jgi:hypothetical protein
MTTTNIFEVAVRNKMRFPYKGMSSVEDLWELSLVSLNHIFQTLNAELKQSQEDSLLIEKSKGDKELEVKIEIVKYIVGVKQAEAQAKAEEKEKKEKKQRLLEILDRKENEALENMSSEQLRTMLDQL